MGQKRLGGVAVLHDEVKKVAAYTLTPTAIANIQRTAKVLGISASEFIEQTARGVFRQRNRVDISDETLALLELKAASLGINTSELIAQIARAELKAEFSPQLERRWFWLSWF